MVNQISLSKALESADGLVWTEPGSEFKNMRFGEIKPKDASLFEVDCRQNHYGIFDGQYGASMAPKLMADSLQAIRDLDAHASAKANKYIAETRFNNAKYVNSITPDSYQDKTTGETRESYKFYMKLNQERGQYNVICKNYLVSPSKRFKMESVDQIKDMLGENYQHVTLLFTIGYTIKEDSMKLTFKIHGIQVKQLVQNQESGVVQNRRNTINTSEIENMGSVFENVTFESPPANYLENAKQPFLNVRYKNDPMTIKLDDFTLDRKKDEDGKMAEGVGLPYRDEDTELRQMTQFTFNPEGNTAAFLQAFDAHCLSKEKEIKAAFGIKGKTTATYTPLYNEEGMVPRCILKFKLDKLKLRQLEPNGTSPLYIKDIDDMYDKIRLGTEFTNVIVMPTKAWYAKGLKKWGVSMSIFAADVRLSTSEAGTSGSGQQDFNPDMLFVSDDEDDEAIAVDDEEDLLGGAPLEAMDLKDNSVDAIP